MLYVLTEYGLLSAGSKASPGEEEEEEEKEEEEQRVFKRPLSLSPLIGGELGETGVMFKEVGVSELKFLWKITLSCSAQWMAGNVKTCVSVPGLKYCIAVGKLSHYKRILIYLRADCRPKNCVLVVGGTNLSK